MEYNCVYRPLGIKKIVNCSIIWNIMEYRPLEMKCMICSSERIWVMVDIIELHVCNCS